MSSEVNICAVCAWRAACQKKFSISGRDMRCADFSKDLSIKEPNQHKTESDEKKDR